MKNNELIKSLKIKLKELQKQYEKDANMLLRSDIDQLKLKINPNYFTTGHKNYGKI